MVYWLEKFYRDYKTKTINSSSVGCFWYAFHYPRSICRIIAIMGLVFLFSDIILLLINTIFDVQFKLKMQSFSNNDFKFSGEVDLKHFELTDKKIYSLLYQKFVFYIFFFVNVDLLIATEKRYIKGIVIWLLAHITHMFYSLSFHIWFGVYTNSFSIILISIFNTMLYLMFIFMVTLFWLSERYSCCRRYRATINMI